MNRTIRAAIGSALVLISAFAAISICQNIGRGLKADVTEQNLYTLSDGTKAILKKINQPIKAKLYYAKTASLKGPDQIRFFSNYYEFVRALLEEYVAASNGMIDLEIVDPRPYSPEEEQALKYGLQRFPITREESFFFGLVVQTKFGVEKVIPFFSPDRQNFVEYDISSLIDTAVTRQKRKVGILSSISVMGDESTPWMAEMKRRQGQQPEPAWTIVEQLRKQYEVSQVPTDTNDINDVDILLVIHPKDLSEQTQFAIDQFILKGGRAIICVDPHCFADRPDRMQMQMGQPPSQSSELNTLLRTWGLEVPAMTFAGDRNLAVAAPLRQGQRAERIIGFLNTTPERSNGDSVITAPLNEVRFLFSGVVKEVDPAGGADGDDPNAPKEAASEIERIPLVTTTAMGNTFSITSPYEFMMLDPGRLMTKFIDGTKPVAMAYMVNGRLKSSFPDGIDIEVTVDSNDVDDPNAEETVTKHVTGLTEATENCSVVVFADVDFISDGLAFQDSFFGKLVVGDNSALMTNAVDEMTGSSELISIRSRGNFKRPFAVVDEIERQAEAETAAEVAKLEAEIAQYNKQLQEIVQSAAEKGEQEVVGSSILQKRRELELKIHQANREKREVNRQRRQKIDRLGQKLQNANTLAAPAVILLIAIVLGIRRSVRKRHYISHASDA